MPTAISVENLSKTYRLGQIGTGTLTNDLKVWWARVRGKPNPLLKIGQEDQGNRDGEILWALKDVSFQVEQGEVLGIIGRNGAGKSTLLKILSRVTAPTSGQIKVKGRIASLLEVGTGFHPELTGRENIYLNGAILGMSRKEIDRKFDEIVDFAEVEQFIDTPVKRYSSGMYVRLAFAVAAHLESEILLVDEVLAVGDAEFQKKCLGKMGDVASKEGRTVLFVSHNMGAVRRLCSECILISAGQISQQGFSEIIIKKYLQTIESNSVSKISTFNDDLIKIKVLVLDNEEKETLTWRINSDLIIDVHLQTKKTIKNPSIDLSFYDGSLRLFSIQSESFCQGPETIYGNFFLRFIVSNPGFINSEIYFDVGIREGKNDYLVLIRNAGIITPNFEVLQNDVPSNCLLHPQSIFTWSKEK